MVDSRLGASGDGLQSSAAIVGLVNRRIRQAERSSKGTVRVSVEGKGHILDFTRSTLAKIERRGLSRSVDADILTQQIVELVPVFLRSVRAEARARRAIRRPSARIPSLPVDLIVERLPEFMAKRCHCWPQ